MVFALGVVLLELSWGKPLLDLKTADDLNDQGKEDSMTELYCISAGGLDSDSRASKLCISRH